MEGPTLRGGESLSANEIALLEYLETSFSSREILLGALEYTSTLVPSDTFTLLKALKGSIEFQKRAVSPPRSCTAEESFDVSASNVSTECLPATSFCILNSSVESAADDLHVAVTDFEAKVTSFLTELKSWDGVITKMRQQSELLDGSSLGIVAAEHQERTKEKGRIGQQQRTEPNNQKDGIGSKYREDNTGANNQNSIVPNYEEDQYDIEPNKLEDNIGSNSQKYGTGSNNWEDNIGANNQNSIVPNHDEDQYDIERNKHEDVTGPNSQKDGIDSNNREDGRANNQNSIVPNHEEDQYDIEPNKHEDSIGPNSQKNGIDYNNREDNIGANNQNSIGPNSQKYGTGSNNREDNIGANNQNSIVPNHDEDQYDIERNKHEDVTGPNSQKDGIDSNNRDDGRANNQNSIVPNHEEDQYDIEPNKHEDSIGPNSQKNGFDYNNREDNIGDNNQNSIGPNSQKYGTGSNNREDNIGANNQNSIVPNHDEDQYDIERNKHEDVTGPNSQRDGIDSNNREDDIGANNQNSIVPNYEEDQYCIGSVSREDDIGPNNQNSIVPNNEKDKYDIGPNNQKKGTGSKHQQEDIVPNNQEAGPGPVNDAVATEEDSLLSNLLNCLECPFTWKPDVVVSEDPNFRIQDNMVEYLTGKEEEFRSAKPNMFRALVIHLVLGYERAKSGHVNGATQDLYRCYQLLEGKGKKAEDVPVELPSDSTGQEEKEHLYEWPEENGSTDYFKDCNMREDEGEEDTEDNKEVTVVADTGNEIEEKQRLLAFKYIIECCVAHISLLRHDRGLALDVAQDCALRYREFSPVSRAAVLAVKGSVLCEYGNEGNAVGVVFLREALQLDPDYWQWNLYCGKVLGRLRRIYKSVTAMPDEEELQLLSKAVSLQGGDAACLMHLGNVYRGLASAHYREANAMQGATPMGRPTTRRQNYQSHEDYRRSHMMPKHTIRSAASDKYLTLAKKLFLDALKLEPDCPYNNARCAKGLWSMPYPFRDKELAQRAILHALTLAPDDSLVNHYAGLFYEFNHDHEKALKCYERATGGGKNNFPANMSYVNLRMKMSPGSYSPLLHLDIILQKYTSPNNRIHTLCTRAFFHRSEKQPVQAIRFFCKAIEVDPRHFTLKNYHPPSVYGHSGFVCDVYEILDNMLEELTTGRDCHTYKAFTDGIIEFLQNVKQKYNV